MMDMKPGRNDPCPCGSNRKYKQCCLLRDEDGKTAGSRASVLQSLQTALGHYQAGRLQQAGDVCRGVLEASPDHPDALHLAGLLARQEGRNDLAVELIGRAIRISPAALMYFNLGNAYRAQGKFDEAAESFRKAIGLKPDYAQAYNNLGLVLQLQGKLDAATDL
jgi:tetratricopeptide (TPR) repeat protein